MIYIGLKKWEIAVLACLLGAALTARLLEDFGVIKIPLPLVVAVIMPLAAALILWRPIGFLLSFRKLGKNGCRVKAVVTDYKTVGTGAKRQTIEVIRFKDNTGKNRKKELQGAFMPKRMIGREYTLFYNPENEDDFLVSPQCFISLAIDLVFAVLIVIPFIVIMFAENKS